MIFSWIPKEYRPPQPPQKWQILGVKTHFLGFSVFFKRRYGWVTRTYVPFAGRKLKKNAKKTGIYHPEKVKKKKTKAPKRNPLNTNWNAGKQKKVCILLKGNLWRIPG